MNILQLLSQDGFNPVFSARTDGGEYSSFCPLCGGTDRFRIWPVKDKAWCRNPECNWNPDSIDYLQRVRKLTFNEAKEVSGQNLKGSQIALKPFKSHSLKPQQPRSALWFEKSLNLIGWAENRLQNTPDGQGNLEWLSTEKGINQETARVFHLGWNPFDVFRQRHEWGLPDEFKADGKKKKLFIPKGLVIPAISQSGKLENVRIRRPEGDPKYFLLPGSSKSFLICGNTASMFCFVVESDLDAILLHQEAGDLACFVSTGSTSYHPTPQTAEFLHSKKLFLSQDADEAGAKTVSGYWKPSFPNAQRWPVIQGKDPSEAKKNGLDLRAWVLAAIGGGE